jgi:hypothetical protein
MSISKLFFVLLILSVFAAPICVSGAFAAYSENTAASAIDRAEAAMVSAYEAVSDAEQAGANVSRLLDRLNVAGEHLDEAHMLYRLGNFDGAIHSADLSSEIGADVKNEAEELKIEAYGSWIRIVWIRIIGSIVGVIFVVFGAFIVWRVFKRRYVRSNIEKMKKR